MEKWTKLYYRILLAGLLGFAAILFWMNHLGIAMPFLLLIFFVFYLAFKNGLQSWVKAQVSKEDPEYGIRRIEEKKKQIDTVKLLLFPRSPWYKNESIGVILLLILAFLFGFR